MRKVTRFFMISLLLFGLTAPAFAFLFPAIPVGMVAAKALINLAGIAILLKTDFDSNKNINLMKAIRDYKHLTNKVELEMAFRPPNNKKIVELLGTMKKKAIEIRKMKMKLGVYEPPQDVPEGECDPLFRDNPYLCCLNFINKFMNQQELMYQIGANAFVVKPNGVTEEKSCCYEWDRKHGRFEVFVKGGDLPLPFGGGSYTHLGEQICEGRKWGSLSGRDLCDKILASNKADGNGGHAPRDGCADYRKW
jgi:hypothetical protein